MNAASMGFELGPYSDNWYSLDNNWDAKSFCFVFILIYNVYMVYNECKKH